jgi:hypothetical protein
VALCQARISTKPLWGFSSSNPYHSQSRAEHTVYMKYNFKKTKAAQSASQGQAKDQKKFSEAEQYKPCFAESNIKIAHSLLEL